MEETRVANVFFGRKPATGDMPAFEAKHLQSRQAEVCLEDQTVMPRADYDAVVRHQSEAVRPKITGRKTGERGTNMNSDHELDSF